MFSLGMTPSLGSRTGCDFNPNPNPKNRSGDEIRLQLNENIACGLALRVLTKVVQISRRNVSCLLINAATCWLVTEGLYRLLARSALRHDIGVSANKAESQTMPWSVFLSKKSRIRYLRGNEWKSKHSKRWKAMAQLPERCFFQTIVVVVHNAFVDTELKIEITKYEMNSLSLKQSVSTKGHF